MGRKIIIADDKIPFLRGVMDPYVDIYYLPGSKITASDVDCADAIFTRTRTKCNSALLDRSNVQLIATATIGYDHIDTDYCNKNRISWVNAPGCNSGSVRQYVLTAILNFARIHKWNLAEKTIGVIGAGNVGRKVAEAAKAIGMRVLLNDPPRQANEGDNGFCDLSQLLSESDIITCHTPLARSGLYPTYHLAGKDFFRQIKEGALFINTSRGEVVDEDALKQFLHKLSGFVLDVWENEPNIDPILLKEAFIATPHIAGYSADGKAAGTAACVRAFISHFKADFLSEEWYPEQIPPSDKANEKITIYLKPKRLQQIAFSLMDATYPIFGDSKELKKSPQLFEQLRGNYWIRREPEYFTPYVGELTKEDILAGNKRTRDILNLFKALGFKKILIHNTEEWKI